LLPKAISLYLKYKYHLNVKIGTAGLFSLQDIIFLKNGYSVVCCKQKIQFYCLSALSMYVSHKTCYTMSHVKHEFTVYTYNDILMNYYFWQHIDNIGFRSSFISSEVNKLVCLVARDVRIEKNIERNDSTIMKQNQSNNNIDLLLPIVMKFAQVNYVPSIFKIKILTFLFSF